MFRLKTHHLLTLTAGTALALAVASPADASLLTNGDFSDWPTATNPPTGWDNSPTAIGFSREASLTNTDFSLQINPADAGDYRAIRQDIDPTDAFTLTVDFAQETPSASGGRSFHMSFREPSSSTAYRVNGDGTFQALGDPGDGPWMDVTNVGAIASSDFSTNTLTVYRLTLQGSLSGGSIDISLFDVTNNQSIVSGWEQTSFFDPQSSFSQLNFEGGRSESAYRVDNVTLIPEPASLALMGLGGLLMLGFRGRARRSQL